MTERLPDHDEDGWDLILGTRDHPTGGGGAGGFLRVSHNDDGTLKQSQVQTALGLDGNPAHFLNGTGGLSAAGAFPIGYVDAVAEHGVTMDGTTDDTAALNAALAAAAAQSAASGVGGTVLLGLGACRVTSQIVIPNKVRLVGLNRRASRIIADASFPTSTAVVKVGGSATSFDSRLENMTVDANDIAGSQCVYSNFGEEGCGVRDCLLANFRDFAVFFETTGVQHAEIIGAELYGSASGWTGGISLGKSDNTNPCGLVYIDRVTINAQNNSVDGTYGIYGGNSSPFVIGGVHIENVTHGLYVKRAGGYAAVLEATTTDVTNMVTIDSTFTGSLFVGWAGGAGTYQILDNARSVNSGTESQMVGYQISNKGTTKGRVSTGALLQDYRNNLVQFAGGAVMLTKAGTPVDGDFPITPPNGAMAIDTTNNKIYVRIGGTWKSVTVT